MRQLFSHLGTTRRYRAFMFALSIGAAIFTLPPASHALPDLSLEPASSSVEIDDVLTIELRITGASNVYGWQVDVFFDPAVISVLSTTEGTFLSDGGFTTFFLNGTLDNGTGVVNDILATRLGAVPGENGDGLLAELSFQAVGSGMSAITLGNVILSDPFAQPLAVGTLNGASVAVAPPVPALSPLGTGLFLLLTTAALYVVRRRRSCCGSRKLV